MEKDVGSVESVEERSRERGERGERGGGGRRKDRGREEEEATLHVLHLYLWKWLLGTCFAPFPSPSPVESVQMSPLVSCNVFIGGVPSSSSVILHTTLSISTYTHTHTHTYTHIHTDIHVTITLRVMGDVIETTCTLYMVEHSV